MKSSRPQAKAVLQMENERVIITQWKFSPGAETGWHKHAYDYIVVPNMKGTLLMESKDGNKTANLEEGQSYYRPVGVEHNVINSNDYAFSFVEIELK